MHAQIHTIAFRGIETIDVTVQIHIANGLPAMAIVGLADKAVAESRERVRDVTYPAQFQLIAAMNPCRCGYLGDPRCACSRAPSCGQNYQAKISGPMMDRLI